MKKILIIGLLLLIALSVFGQNKFKYPVNANGGLRVGGDDHDLIDSVKLVTGDVVIYIGGVAYAASGATIVDVRGEIEDSLNVLRPLVVMVADTGTMLTPYINRADTSGMLVNYILTSEANAAYANKALSNLASVAINTHLLPGVDGAVNLGSATYKWGNIFIDTAKVINFNNGDVTITHSDQNLTVAGGNMVIPAITGPLDITGATNIIGTTNITELSIGNSTSNTLVQLDSLGIVDSKIAAYINSDTTNFYTTVSGRQEISDIVIMIDDTVHTSGKHYFYTQWQVDSLAATISGTSITDVRDEINDSLDVLRDDIKFNVDTTGIFVFGKGDGNAADSVGFAKGAKGFGSFNNKTDTLYVVDFDNLFLTSGDSLIFNAYYGNRMTGVATDSLFTNPQPVGTDENLLVPTRTRKIPPGMDVWLELKSNQLTGLRPKQWEIQLNGYIIRDH